MTKRTFMILMAVWFANSALFSPAEGGVLENRIEESIAVITESRQMPEQSIPENLFDRCAAIAVFPGMLKGGFIFGGRHGRGIIIARNERTGRWSPPAFFTLWGGSYGFQAGLQSVDLILFMSRKGLEGLLDSKATLGADIGVAAGPIGRRTEAGTDASLKAEIQSYSRSRGVFAGLSVAGAAIVQDRVANRAFYGMEVSARDILSNFDMAPPTGAKALINALNKTELTKEGV